EDTENRRSGRVLSASTLAETQVIRHRPSIVYQAYVARCGLSTLIASALHVLLLAGLIRRMFCFRQRIGSAQGVTRLRLAANPLDRGHLLGHGLRKAGRHDGESVPPAPRELLLAGARIQLVFCRLASGIPPMDGGRWRCSFPVYGLGQ